LKDSIYIEKGVQDKTILKVENKGHRGFKHSSGDLYITVFIEQSNKFKIDGNNVYSEHTIDYLTAVFGG
jgi:DnaJ-class molecular chaperone